MKQVSRRALFWMITVLLVGGALVYGFWPKPMPVATAVVERGDLAVTVEEDGKTRLRDRYLVRAPLAAHARRTELEAGDAVRSGDTLLWLEPMRAAPLDPRTRAQAAAHLDAARARLEAAEERAAASEAQAEVAEREYRRARSLFGAGALSRQALDASRAADLGAQAALRESRHGVEAARGALQAARSALRFTGEPAERGGAVAVTSPVEGRVLRVFHKSAGPVQPGQELMVIGDPTRLEAVVDVLSDDAVRLEPGMHVEFERWGGAVNLEGRLRLIEPAGFTKVSALGVEEQRVKVSVEFTSDRSLWSELGENYRVLARFVLWEGKDILIVPRSAVFSQNGADAVFVIEQGRARVREVKLGKQSGLEAEVLDGLESGEVVVTHPDPRVVSGARVKPNESEVESGAKVRRNGV